MSNLFYRHFRPAVCFTAALAASLIICAPFQGRAETLDQLIKSPRMAEFKQSSEQIRREALRDAVWMDPDSNYAQVFKNSKGPDLLLSWLSGSTPGYTKLESKGRKLNDVTFATAKYLARDNGAIVDLTMMLPHPRNLATSALGLFEPIKNLQTPPENVSISEAVQVRAQPAVLYATMDKHCALVMKTIKGGVLRLNTDKCEDPAKLTEFTRGLDIQRMLRKLES